MAALTIDGDEFPVLISTWRETIFVPGSRARTETGAIRSVRLGCPLSTFTGSSFFATRVEADVMRDVLLTYGDHVVSGVLPGKTVLCETDCGPIEAVDHRPTGFSGTPTAMWRLSWTLIQVSCEEVEEEVPVVPAGIMLVTGLTSSTSTTRIKTALEAAGHTVTIVDHDEFSTGFTPYTPYELIFLSEVRRNSSKGSKVREVIQSGRPVVNAPDSWSDGVSVQPLLYHVGLHAGTSYISRFENGNEILILEDDHYITEEQGAGVIEVLEDTDERINQVLNGAVIGTVLATGQPGSSNHDGKAVLVAYNTGTLYLTGEEVEVTAARVVFLGWGPDDTTLTADGTELIQRAVTWALAG
jgi:hypothetical protein